MDAFSSLVNPPQVTIGSETTRFSQAAWFRFVQDCDILIAGVGGIGSWLAFMISRLNPNGITLVDDDVIDRTNLAGQFFSRNDIGKEKVEAMCNTLSQWSSYYDVSANSARITESTGLPGIVLCGFDNMLARKAAFFSWKRSLVRNGQERSLFIDGRLSAETLQVFCIQGTDDYYMAEYEKHWLFSDSEAESTICSYKQTSYCANLIASLMTNLFVNWCTNKCGPLIDRSLPFMIEYSAEQMYLKSEV